jgi:hypothetical protein
MSKPKVEEVLSFLSGERDFDEGRVEKTAHRLEEAYKVGQSTLDRWF